MIFTFQWTFLYGKVALGGIKVIWPGISSHHACVSLHQPISHLALWWHHLSRSNKRLLAGVLALPEGEFGNVVLNFNLSRSAIVKFNGEGGMALHYRGCRRSFSVCVFCWDNLHLLLCSFGPWLQILGCDFKVICIPSTEVNGLFLMFREWSVKFLSRVFFLFFCENI